MGRWQEYPGEIEAQVGPRPPPEPCFSPTKVPDEPKKKLKVTPIPAQVLAKVPEVFNAAVEAWNKQAKLPKNQRNGEDQEPLGPFK